MSDYNVFAVLTAQDKKNKAVGVMKLPENQKWYREGHGAVASRRLITDREGTPSYKKGDDDDDGTRTTFDRLVITFDLLSSTHGLLFGTDLSSDVVLGHRGTKGVSRKQYNIIVDEHLRIWLCDFHSKHGSAVSHDDDEPYALLQEETWILAYEPSSEDNFNFVVLHAGGLVFQIEFPNHNKDAHGLYIENLQRFSQACKAAAIESKNRSISLSQIRLESAKSTQAPSKAYTPRKFLVYFPLERLGEGAFGEVFRAARARDGAIVAIKKFFAPANKRKLDEDEAEWLRDIRREFTVMKDHPHSNVVCVLDFQERPEPLIAMTFYPDGSLAKHTLSETQYVSALGQLLDGLDHLHSHGVVHRDLKPENFLLVRKPLFKVVISDFGLSKVMGNESLLQSQCGTPGYMAPEMFSGQGYGPEADVWSLGVIGFEWLYGLPHRPNYSSNSYDYGSWSLEWAELLVDAVHDEEKDSAIRILRHMITTDHYRRWSAHGCLSQGFHSRLFKRRVMDGQVIDAMELDEDATDGEDTEREETGEEEEEEEETDSIRTIICAPSPTGQTAKQSSPSSAGSVVIGGQAHKNPPVQHGTATKKMRLVADFFGQ